MKPLTTLACVGKQFVQRVLLIFGASSLSKKTQLLGTPYLHFGLTALGVPGGEADLDQPVFAL